ncbi:MAG: hypothetical protein IPI52_06015 [Bacteroidetes bacterium]|nr:hypothetical protein [Bacteroidota bacterium]
MAAAGIATIGIVDDDLWKIAICKGKFFGVSDIGQPKVKAAKNKLKHSIHINIITFQERLISQNAYSIFSHLIFRRAGWTTDLDI